MIECLFFSFCFTITNVNPGEASYMQVYWMQTEGNWLSLRKHDAHNLQIWFFTGNTRFLASKGIIKTTNTNISDYTRGNYYTSATHNRGAIVTFLWFRQSSFSASMNPWYFDIVNTKEPLCASCCTNVITNRTDLRGHNSKVKVTLC